MEPRAEEPAPRHEGADGARRYGTIVVVGGGCYGSYYVRQLTRASDAGALCYARLVVVDRDPDCRLAQARDAALELRPRLDATTDTGVRPHHLTSLDIRFEEWAAFFAHYLGVAADDPAGVSGDAIVPSPLMPHLMYDWLLARARVRSPERPVRTVPLARAPSTPWERSGADGTHFVSFAEWMCPINCIEPARCPETRGPRSWSMPDAMRAYVAAEDGWGRPLRGPLLMRCLHRAFGVGMFDTSEVLAADGALRELATRDDEPTRVLVGTVSHCHGALNLLEIGAPERRA